MPTIFILFGFCFMFYANNHEPIHVHVVKENISAKFTLFPVTLVKNTGLKPSELKLVESIIEENQETFRKTFFGYYRNNPFYWARIGYCINILKILAMK